MATATDISIDLLDEAPAAPEAAPAQDAPAEAAADAAKPDPASDYEQPWLKDVFGGKYRKVADLEKGYSESSKQAREFKKAAEEAAQRWQAVEGLIGAPVDEKGEPLPYDLKLPEGVEIDPELMRQAEGLLRKHNLSGKFAQDAFESFILPWQAGLEMGMREIAKENVVKTLGGGDEAVAKQTATRALQWAAGLLGDDAEALDRLRGCTASDDALITLASLHAAMNGVSMGASTGAGGFGKEQYQAVLAKQASGKALTAEEQAAMVAYLNRQHPDE